MSPALSVNSAFFKIKRCGQREMFMNINGMNKKEGAG